METPAMTPSTRSLESGCMEFVLPRFGLCGRNAERAGKIPARSNTRLENRLGVVPTRRRSRAQVSCAFWSATKIAGAAGFAARFALQTVTGTVPVTSRNKKAHARHRPVTALIYLQHKGQAGGKQHADPTGSDGGPTGASDLALPLPPVDTALSALVATPWALSLMIATTGSEKDDPRNDQNCVCFGCHRAHRVGRLGWPGFSRKLRKPRSWGK